MAATKTGISVGSTFARRFAVEEFVGSGPMAEVFRVIENGKYYALKVFLPRVIPAHIGVEKLKGVYAEKTALHPAIVRPLEIGEADGMKFLKLPYVDGSSLQKLFDAMADDGRLGDPATAGLIAERIVTILEQLPHGTVHGGIKPSNVLIAEMPPGGPLPDDSPFYLTDMGVCCLLSFSKYASLQLSAGSPYYYLACEFVGCGGKIDARADQYSLGALLYEFLTGKPPRKGFRPASQVNRTVPEEWDDLLAKMMATKPEQRFAKYAELRERLVEIAGAAPAVPAVDLSAEAAARPAEQDAAFAHLLDGAIARSEALDRGAAPTNGEGVFAVAETAASGAATFEEVAADVGASAAEAAEMFADVESGAAAHEPSAAENEALAQELSEAGVGLFGEEAPLTTPPPRAPAVDEPLFAEESALPSLEPPAELPPEMPAPADRQLGEHLFDEPATEQPALPGVDATTEPAEPSAFPAETAEPVLPKPETPFDAAWLAEATEAAAPVVAPEPIAAVAEPALPEIETPAETAPLAETVEPAPSEPETPFDAEWLAAPAEEAAEAVVASEAAAEAIEPVASEIEASPAAELPAEEIETAAPESVVESEALAHAVEPVAPEPEPAPAIETPLKATVETAPEPELPPLAEALGEPLEPLAAPPEIDAETESVAEAPAAEEWTAKAEPPAEPAIAPEPAPREFSAVEHAQAEGAAIAAEFKHDRRAPQPSASQPVNLVDLLAHKDVSARELEETPAPYVAPAPARRIEPPKHVAKPTGRRALWVATLIIVLAGAAIAGFFGYQEGWFNGANPPPPVQKAPPPAPVVEAAPPAAAPEPSPEAPAAPAAPSAAEKIAALVAQADGLIATKQYVKPAAENALALVKQIEQLDAQNAYPEQARRTMLKDLAARTDQALANQQYAPALELAQQGLQIRPTDAAFAGYLAKAQAGLGSQPDPQRLAKLTTQLQWYIKHKVYVRPAGSCALSTIEDLERIQPTNDAAAKARKDIVARQTQDAQTGIKNSQWDNAMAAADDGLLADPNNAALAGLRAKAQSAKEQAAAATPVPAPAAAVAKTCPTGMRYIPAGSFRMGSSPDDPLRTSGEKTNTPTLVQAYCVDLYEYPNKPGAPPKTNIAWQDAEASCESQGKRLCSEAEWERACKGPGNQRYPYGNEYKPNVCATQIADGQKRYLTASGQAAGCRSTFGIYDMSGAAREWTGTPGQGSPILKGGGVDDADWGARCAVRMSAAPSSKSYLIGFRCCAPAPE